MQKNKVGNMKKLEEGKVLYPIFFFCIIHGVETSFVFTHFWADNKVCRQVQS